MRLQIDAHLDYQLHAPADLLVAMEAAMLPDQRLVTDRLVTRGTGPLVPVAGEDGVGRRTWTRGESRVEARYTATVELDRAVTPIAGLAADPLPRLPADVTRYIFSSRYCEADQFDPYVRRRFGHVQGGAKVQAMLDWMAAEMAYVPGASNGTTTAADSFVRREGVCRDFAHVLIAMARAAEIPARMVGCYAPDVRPQDFHAVVEVWLEGGWHLVDPTGFAAPDTVVRIGVGRDATDVSFLTVFGTASLVEQWVTVARVG
jgi:transglutaminase-like putative cysteine protease